MTDSADDERFSGPHGAGESGTTRRPSFTPAGPGAAPTRAPTQSAGLSRPAADSRPGEDPPHPVTEVVAPRPADAEGWERTATAPGGPRAPGLQGPGSQARGSQGPDGAGGIRWGPGVPGAAPVSQPAITAEEVWRTGQLPRPRPRRWRRRTGTALTAVLLVACGVLVYLRLHHAPLSVTGVAITSQVKSGCAVNVTGRIGTAGGAGTVSYEWVFTPQTAAPQPLSQSVSAGQPAYVTVSDQGTGHGQAAQQVTLKVLSPGQGSASTHVNISC
ncbi:MAG TPA: hypothetical protein VGG83_27800 [Trebonia sp.]